MTKLGAYLKQTWGVESVGELTPKQIECIKENASEGYELDKLIVALLKVEAET